jgi:outer membrane protein assembly factor BamD
VNTLKKPKANSPSSNPDAPELLRVRPFSILRACLSFAIAGILLTGCGSSKPKDLAGDCKIRYDKTHAKYLKKRYATAKEEYADFVTACSGTEFAEEAYFELAESHFALKEWMEAEEEYEAFLKEYPGSRKYGETVRYKLAISMAKQTLAATKDQSKTLDAIHEFETFIAEFPDSPRLDSARSEVDRLRDLLATRDSRIAKLYTRMDEPLAAAIYYKHILKEYGDRIQRREITLKLTECYIELEQFVEAENLLAQFDGVAKDDPFREKIKNLRSKLDKARERYARHKKQEKKEEEKRQAEQKSETL